MSESAVAVMIVFLAGVFPCFVFGYLIAFKGKRNLIAGWDESKVRDPSSYGSVVGWSLLILALLLAVFTYSLSVSVISELLFACLVVAASFIPLAGWFYAKRKYG